MTWFDDKYSITTDCLDNFVDINGVKYQGTPHLIQNTSQKIVNVLKSMTVIDSKSCKWGGAIPLQGQGNYQERHTIKCTTGFKSCALREYFQYADFNCNGTNG